MLDEPAAAGAGVQAALELAGMLRAGIHVGDLLTLCGHPKTSHALLLSGVQNQDTFHS
jgi:hypothetical protein